MHVFPKKEVLARQPSPRGIPLNVALIMFDSTSAANFRRKMPNSLEYLTNNLNSLLMRGEIFPKKQMLVPASSFELLHNGQLSSVERKEEVKISDCKSLETKQSKTATKRLFCLIYVSIFLSNNLFIL